MSSDNEEHHSSKRPRLQPQRSDESERSNSEFLPELPPASPLMHFMASPPHAELYNTGFTETDEQNIADLIAMNRHGFQLEQTSSVVVVPTPPLQIVNPASEFVIERSSPVAERPVIARYQRIPRRIVFTHYCDHTFSEASDRVLNVLRTADTVEEVTETILIHHDQTQAYFKSPQMIIRLNWLHDRTYQFLCWYDFITREQRDQNQPFTFNLTMDHEIQTFLLIFYMNILFRMVFDYRLDDFIVIFRRFWMATLQVQLEYPSFRLSLQPHLLYILSLDDSNNWEKFRHVIETYGPTTEFGTHEDVIVPSQPAISNAISLSTYFEVILCKNDVKYIANNILEGIYFTRHRDEVERQHEEDTRRISFAVNIVVNGISFTLRVYNMTIREYRELHMHQNNYPEFRNGQISESRYLFPPQFNVPREHNHEFVTLADLRDPVSYTNLHPVINNFISDENLRMFDFCMNHGFNIHDSNDFAIRLVCKKHFLHYVPNYYRYSFRLKRMVWNQQAAHDNVFNQMMRRLINAGAIITAAPEDGVLRTALRCGVPLEIIRNLINMGCTPYYNNGAALLDCAYGLHRYFCIRTLKIHDLVNHVYDDDFDEDDFGLTDQVPTDDAPADAPEEFVDLDEIHTELFRTDSFFQRFETDLWIERLRYILSFPDMRIENEFESITDMTLLQCQNIRTIRALFRLGFRFRRELAIPRNPLLYILDERPEFNAMAIPGNHFYRTVIDLVHTEDEINDYDSVYRSLPDYVLPDWIDEEHPISRRFALLRLCHE